MSKSNSVSQKKIKAILLSLIIAIVLTAFVIYFIQAIYPSPEYEDYCDIKEREISIPENPVIVGGTCATVSPESRQECCENKGYELYNEETGKCEDPCREKYETARNKYKLIVFIIAVIVGLLAVSTGVILALPSVSSGLMLGGAFLTFYGTAIYWSKLNNWLRVIILGIVLTILIWLGYKKLQN